MALAAMAPERSSAFFIGVAGGACCGKSTVCTAIVDALNPTQGTRVKVIKLSCFYKDLSSQENPNYDHPDAFDWNVAYEVLKALKNKESVQVPGPYDETTSTRGKAMMLSGCDVIIFEGILVLYKKEIRDLLDLKVFVDLDSDARLALRVTRDLERGRDLASVLTTYTTVVKPSFEDFILPTKGFADVILPRGSDNRVAISMLVQHVKAILDGERGRRDSLSGTVPTTPTSSRPH